jgi:hypothetical protein
MSTRFKVGALALAATLAACDRTPPTAVPDDAAPPQGATVSRYAVERNAMDRLARRLARALANSDFRTYLKAELDRSPVVEHKLHFQKLLEASDRRVLKQLARLSETPESEVETDVKGAIPLEIYFPVPAHRAAWSGDPEVLVASAREDNEAPIAYDIRGRRQVLRADQPPATPVLAMVPVETDFDHLPTAEQTCTESCGGGGGGTVTPPAGMYMTYSHFVQDFEGWLKGSPEFEFHILGQAGTSDSLRDYQCAGGAAGGYYRFDQNDLNWSGSVLLFSQAQLNNYKAAHPNQNFRIIALEDDDTGCVIKFDANRFSSLIRTLSAAYPNLTGSKDTSSTLTKWVKRANALQKILAAAYSFITSQDDLIGNAIENVVAGVSYPNVNWVVKGENNVTNGWIKLEMR